MDTGMDAKRQEHEALRLKLKHALERLKAGVPWVVAGAGLDPALEEEMTAFAALSRGNESRRR